MDIAMARCAGAREPKIGLGVQKAGIGTNVGRGDVFFAVASFTFQRCVLSLKAIPRGAVIEALPVEPDKREVPAMVFLVTIGAGALPVGCMESCPRVHPRAEFLVTPEAIRVADSLPECVTRRAV